MTSGILDILKDAPSSKKIRYLHPSTLIGIQADRVCVVGPKSYVEVRGTKTDSIAYALKVCGAIRQTTAETYCALAEFYRNPLLSRTTAFIDAISKHPNAALEKLHRIKNMSIAIIGCGGLGNATAFLLASLGVRGLTLIDSDTVELSNLNRQFLFTRSSIGKLKVDEAKRALLERFSQTVITTVTDSFPSIEAQRALSDATHIICCADDPPDLFKKVHSFCRADQQLWSGGYAMGVSATRRHRYYDGSPSINWLRRTQYFAPSIGFQNMEIASKLVARIVIGRTRQSIELFDYREM